MSKHLAIDVPSDLHDGFVAGATFSQFCDEGVPVIVPPSFHFCFVRAVFQAVLNEVMCRIGSDGLGLPQGNTYHSSLISPNRLRYHARWSMSAW